MHIIKESRHGNTLLNNKCSVINKCLQLLSYCFIESRLKWQFQEYVLTRKKGLDRNYVE